MTVVDPTDPVDEQTSETLRDRAMEQVFRSVAAPDPEPTVARYDRSPVAAVRLIAAMVGLIALEAMAELLPRAVAGLEVDLRAHGGSWATAIGELSDAIATGLALLVLVASTGAAALGRRPRQMITSLVAAGLAAAVVLVGAHYAGLTPGRLTGQEWQIAVIAAAVAMSAASFSVFTTPVARWSSGVITVFTVGGALGDDVSLISRLMVILLGEAIGALVALVVGTASRRILEGELRAGLERARLPIEDLTRHGGDARGSQPWTGTLRTGRTIFVKVEAVEELRAAQLFRLWRRVRLKRPEDEPVPSSVRRSGEHEAFVAQRAQIAGVRTPSVIGIGVIPDDRGVFTVFEAIDGVTLDEVDDLLDATLRAAWSQIQILRRAGIAHRDLRAANLMCSDDEPWVIDFGFAEIAASDTLLQRDVAEFLASGAAVVGPQRAVNNAVAVLGPDVVAESIPWIQPLAVSAATRAALSKDTFADLRERVRAASGLSAPDIPQLQRVTWKGLAITAALGVAIWTLLPQLTSGIDWSAALHADKRWMAAALVASALTYVGAAISVAGSVTESPPLVPTFFAQLASSFTNRVTPAKVGGLALNLRFLTKQGIDSAVAATGLAVSTAAGTVFHVVITVIVVVWAGNVGLPGLSAPPAWVGLVVVGLIAVSAVVVLVVPVGRRWWSNTAVPAMKRSLRSFLEVIRSPRNLIMLSSGSILVTAANLAAFCVSVRAFGVDTPVATLGVVYLAGSALASAAPTPGGLGATEAALVAGMAVVGVPENESIPSVLLFRLATFWIPILPGWIALTVLQRRGDL